MRERSCPDREVAAPHLASELLRERMRLVPEVLIRRLARLSPIGSDRRRPSRNAPLLAQALH